MYEYDNIRGNKILSIVTNYILSDIKQKLTSPKNNTTHYYLLQIYCQLTYWEKIII